jgi:hypothetical protein
MGLPLSLENLIEDAKFRNMKKLHDGEFHLLAVGETDSEDFGNAL